MRLLDLYCGAGGASDGYFQTQHFNDITGVDIAIQPNYPYKFIQSNVREFLKHTEFLQSFDLVHASPPCQSFLDSTNSHLSYPNHLPLVRDALIKSQVPYVIENVPEAPLISPKITICGAASQFAGELRVIRHRTFEFSSHFADPVDPFWAVVEDVPCPPKHPRIHTLKRSYSQFGKTDEFKDFVTVTGGGNCGIKAALDAFGYDRESNRMIKAELNQAIPPAYTRYIGSALLPYLKELRSLNVSILGTESS